MSRQPQNPMPQDFEEEPEERNPEDEAEQDAEIAAWQKRRQRQRGLPDPTRH